MQKSGSCLLGTTIISAFSWSLIRIYGSVLNVSSSEFTELGDMGSISAGYWNYLQSLCHCAWYWARQCTDTVLLYCCYLYEFFFLGFRKWQVLRDWDLTLNMYIPLPLFWATWSWALGPDSATCAGLEQGSDYSDWRASEQSSKRCLALVFPWIVEDTWTKGPTVRGFQPLPPDFIWNLGTHDFRYDFTMFFIYMNSYMNS